MKIAVAIVDGTSISQHFARSTCLLIYEILERRISRVERREGTWESHQPSSGECDGAAMKVDMDQQYHAMVVALAGCRAVICRGMGWRAAQELVRGGINPLVIEGDMTPDEAVQQYLDETLVPAPGFCRHCECIAPPEPYEGERTYDKS